jgi:hypothetical protein
MTYGADQMPCPACGGMAESESVDVGVGLMIRGNFHCDCGWEIDGPDDFGFVELDEVEFAMPADGSESQGKPETKSTVRAKRSFGGWK